MSSVKNVIFVVLSHFCGNAATSIAELLSSPGETSATREDKKLAGRIVSLLEAHAETLSVAELDDEDDIEELARIAEDSDTDYDSGEVTGQKEQPSTSCSSPMRRIALRNDKAITMDAAHAIMAFYRSSKKGKRHFPCMKSKFRCLASQHDLNKVLKSVREGYPVDDRPQLFKVLRERLRKWSFDSFDSEITLHDEDFQKMAREIADELQIPSLKASLRWIKYFRERERIVSRKINDVTSARAQRAAQRIKEGGQMFVAEIQ